MIQRGVPVDGVGHQLLVAHPQFLDLSPNPLLRLPLFGDVSEHEDRSEHCVVEYDGSSGIVDQPGAAPAPYITRCLLSTAGSRRISAAGPSWTMRPSSRR